MKLLVDGYNLLHASGVFGEPTDEPTLETARRALLGFLAQQLAARDRSRATIVFDGKDAPRGLPSVQSYESMQVLFSRRQQSADDLIAELIAAEKQPRELLVISSDHGVQRSARQRGCSYEDSEAWVRSLRQTNQSTVEHDPAKPAITESSAERDHWLREFTSNRRETT